MFDIWIIIAGILIIIELLTVSLISIWFAAGAAAAAICAWFESAFSVQFGVFVGASLLFLALMRPIAMHFQHTEKKTPTNADSLIGKEVIVKSSIDNVHSTGSVIVNGQEWSARNEKGNQPIAAGLIVQIVAIRGNKLIVTENIKWFEN